MGASGARILGGRQSIAGFLNKLPMRHLTGILGLLMFLACERETATPIAITGYEYFPLSIGREWHYGLDSIVLRPEIGGIRFDSVRLQAREILVDTLRDLEDQLWYRGERYDRRSDTLPWRFRQTFLLRTETTRALRQADNLTFVKLIFSPREGERWNAQAAFDEYREVEIGGQPMAVYAGWRSRYREVDGPVSVGPPEDSTAQAFTKGLRVDMADEESAIDYRRAWEVYVAEIGLVYRYIEVYDTQCNACCNLDFDQCADLPWREKAERGFILRQWLTQ